MEDQLEILQITELIPYKNFKEKIIITKKYQHKAKLEIVEDKYVYVEVLEVAI